MDSKLPLVCLFLWIIMGFAHSSFSQNVLEASIVGVAGNSLPTEKVVTINLNVDSDLAHLSFKINYNPLLLSVSSSDITPAAAHFTAIGMGRIMSSVDNAAGKIIWSASDFSALPVIGSGNGELLTIKFTVLAELGYQTASIDIESVTAWSTLLNRIDIIPHDGAVMGLIPVSIVSVASSPASTSPLPFRITFATEVTGFTVEDLVVTNGLAGDFTAVSTTEYDVFITPEIDGVVKLIVPENVAQHTITDNGNMEGELSLIFDSTIPFVEFSTTAPEPMNLNPFVVTATFSEDVTGFMEDDLTVTNGIQGSVSGGPRTYTIDITPIDNGLVCIDMGEGKVWDLAGNGNTAATSLCRSYDNINPTVMISSLMENSTNLKPFDLTITFSEVVTRLILSDITVSNGIAASIEEVVSGNVWTVSISPLSHGVVIVNIEEAVVKDQAGNGNQAANPFSILYDLEQPTVSVTCLVDTTPDDIISFTISFSENTIGFVEDDLIITNGLLQEFLETEEGRTYTASVQANVNGSVTVSVPASSAIDEAGNGNIEGSHVVSFSPNFDVDRDGFTNFRDIVFTYMCIIGHTPIVSDGVTLPDGVTPLDVEKRITILRSVGEGGFAPLDVDMDTMTNFRDITFIFLHLFGYRTVAEDVILPVDVTEEDVNDLIEALLL